VFLFSKFVWELFRVNLGYNNILLLILQNIFLLFELLIINFLFYYILLNTLRLI